MIIWVVIGSLTCISLVNRAGASSPRRGEISGWTWLSSIPLWLLLLANRGGFLTWNSIYPGIDPDRIPYALVMSAGLSILLMPFLIGGASPEARARHYCKIWTIYILRALFVFMPWLPGCLG